MGAQMQEKSAVAGANLQHGVVNIILKKSVKPVTRMLIALRFKGFFRLFDLIALIHPLISVSYPHTSSISEC